MGFSAAMCTRVPPEKYPSCSKSEWRASRSGKENQVGPKFTFSDHKGQVGPRIRLGPTKSDRGSDLVPPSRSACLKSDLRSDLVHQVGPKCIFADFRPFVVRPSPELPPNSSPPSTSSKTTLRSPRSPPTTSRSLSSILATVRLHKLQQDIVGCTHLKINSPKLVDLSVAGAFKDLTFDTTPDLAKVSIEWSNEGSQSVENGALCKLAILLRSLPKMNRLELIVPTFQILSAGDVPVSLPDSCQLSELSVSINFEDMQEVLAILCIFRSSPLLKRVDITSISDKSTARICIGDFWEAHDDFNCLFSVLQFINVTAYTGMITELKFIEFVLANAPVLETVKIQLKENIADVLKVYRQLIRIWRISPKVEILIPE